MSAVLNMARARVVYYVVKISFAIHLLPINHIYIILYSKYNKVVFVG